MALIEFKDLPDTSTPIISANLKNNFDYFKNNIVVNQSTYNTPSSGSKWINYDSTKENIPNGYQFLFRIPILLNKHGITWFDPTSTIEGNHIAYCTDNDQEIQFLNIFTKIV